MTKKRRSISLEPAIDEQLRQPGVNASELINKLLTDYFFGPDETSNVLEFRLQQLESEYQDLQERAERKEEEYNELKGVVENQKEERDQRENKLWKEALDKVEIARSYGDKEPVIKTPDSQLGYYTDALGIDLQEFKDELIRRYKDGR